MHGLVPETLLRLLQQLCVHGNSCRRKEGVDGPGMDVPDKGSARGKQLPAVLPVRLSLLQLPPAHCLPLCLPATSPPGCPHKQVPGAWGSTVSRAHRTHHAELCTAFLSPRWGQSHLSQERLGPQTIWHPLLPDGWWKGERLASFWEQGQRLCHVERRAWIPLGKAGVHWCPSRGTTQRGNDR